MYGKAWINMHKTIKIYIFIKNDFTERKKSIMIA